MAHVTVAPSKKVNLNGQKLFGTPLSIIISVLPVFSVGNTTARLCMEGQQYRLRLLLWCAHILHLIVIGRFPKKRLWSMIYGLSFATIDRPVDHPLDSCWSRSQKYSNNGICPAYIQCFTQHVKINWLEEKLHSWWKIKLRVLTRARVAQQRRSSNASVKVILVSIGVWIFATVITIPLLNAIIYSDEHGVFKKERVKYRNKNLNLQ